MIVPCGTDAGYRRHLRTGQPTCRDCREAHAKAVRVSRYQLSPDHGSWKGVRRHLLYGSPVCDRCLAWQDRLERDATAFFLNNYRRTTAAMSLKDAA